MREAQKSWQKNYLLENLKEIHDRLNHIKTTADSGGLPPQLQKKLTETIRVINGTTRSLQNWAVTPREKAEKLVQKRKKKKV
jgi:primosomal protein N''